MSKKKPQGVVYSTNPDFEYDYGEADEAQTLPPARQRLRVGIERNHRGGKTVTVVSGFVGTDDELQQLGRMLKARCGVGGSAKDGLILIQGDRADQVRQILISAGYPAK